MEQMEFGGKWRSWIRGFLSSARASVIVNGSTTKEFALERGIRQGEPLSPFLFILVVEVLNIVTEEVAEQKISKGITLPNMSPIISHIQYADNVIFLVNNLETELLSRSIYYFVGFPPFTYLGMPVVAAMSRI
ncbi:hypothetical protein Lser_V15G07429 [Lactuca serriola]